MASPVKTTIKDIRRLREITGVLTKHGFHVLVRRLSFGAQKTTGDREPLLLTSGSDSDMLEDESALSLIGDDRNEAAIRFRRVLEDLGPTFVKLGQVMSTRPDIVPVEFVNEFRNKVKGATLRAERACGFEKLYNILIANIIFEIRIHGVPAILPIVLKSYRTLRFWS